MSLVLRDISTEFSTQENQSERIVSVPFSHLCDSLSAPRLFSQDGVANCSYSLPLVTLLVVHLQQNLINVLNPSSVGQMMSSEMVELLVFFQLGSSRLVVFVILSGINHVIQVNA